MFTLSGFATVRVYGFGVQGFARRGLWKSAVSTNSTGKNPLQCPTGSLSFTVLTGIVLNSGAHHRLAISQNTTWLM